jgi:hypothetical protein
MSFWTSEGGFAYQDNKAKLNLEYQKNRTLLKTKYQEEK